jgi:5-methylcytosine-specific restriction protein A
MTQQRLHPCPGDGTTRCGVLVAERRCSLHMPKPDAYRGTSASRGYGSHWARYRAGFLAAHPLCGDRTPDAPATTDSLCAKERRVVAASVVDHIVPVTGPDDPTFFEPNAHQALCETCHNRKRQRESLDAQRG